MKGTSTSLAWCRDSRNDWRTELEDGKPPKVLKDAVVDLRACLAKTQVKGARVYDPWKDLWSSVEVESGRIALPPFERSIVIKIDLGG